jgi:hypothetical protein
MLQCSNVSKLLTLSSLSAVLEGSEHLLVLYTFLADARQLFALLHRNLGNHVHRLSRISLAIYTDEQFSGPETAIQGGGVGG